MSYDQIRELPLGWAVAALFVIVMLRANGTYWVGRLAARGIDAGGGRWARLGRVLDSPGVAKGRRLVARHGAPAVTLSFLTVGLQTAVNAAAGMVRMPLGRYLPAVVAGSVIWAFIYATIGLAAFFGLVQLALVSPVGLAAVLLAIALLITWLVLRRRRAPRQDVES